MLARGKKAVEVSEATGVAQETISRWRREDWWKPALQETIDHYLGNPNDMFASMIPAIIRAYEQALEGDDLKLALHAAELAGDRLLGKPLVRQATASVVDVKISISGKGDADVTAYIEQDAVDAEFTVEEE